MNTRFFRAGVGTVIYNDASEVVLFERATHPVGVWEFQQGGINLNEHPEQTLWRELAEEVGLKKTDFSDIAELPEWLPYESSDVYEGALDDRIGQVHRWFFLRLKSEVLIDLTKATDKEVSDYKWVSFKDALKVHGPHKRPVYQKLHTFFRELKK